MIASLIYNTPELVKDLRDQIPEIYLIDASEEPIDGCDLKIENQMWARNWHNFLMNTNEEFVWMLNSDVQGVTMEMYLDMKGVLQLNRKCLMITPRFNSPHALFNQSFEDDVKQVSWIDMTAPLINVNLFKKLGGFDPDFVGYFADIDLCHRARKAGYKMLLDKRFFVNHLGSYTVQKTDKWEQANADDNALLVKKYGKNWFELI